MPPRQSTPSDSPVARRGAVAVGAASEGDPADAAGPDHRDGGEHRLRRLMEGYQRGDAAAFEELHARVAGELRSFLAVLCADSERADDLLQDCFLQMHRARQTYLPSRPFRPWAFAIARHVFRMQRRSNARSRRHEMRFPSIDWCAPAELEHVATREETDRALSLLPPDRREAIFLHHGFGFSFAEIGAVLGVRSGTVKVRVHRALRQLRELLGKETGR